MNRIEAETIIRQIADEIGLTDLSPFDHKKGYDAKLSRAVFEGNNVIFKILPKTEEKRISNYLREAAACKIMTENVAGINITDIITTGWHGDYFWLIRRYKDGEALSPYFSTDLGLFGYDEIQDKYLPKLKQILDRVNENLIKIRAIGPQNKHYAGFEHPRFETDLMKCNPQYIEKGFGISLDNQIAYYDKCSDDYYLPENLSYSISDLVPANIIIGPKGDVILSDFEWFSYDHVLTDPVFLWLYLWKHPEFQEYWYESAIAPISDQDLFRAAIIRHIICWYRNLYSPERDITDKLLANRELWKKHRWTKYLLAAGESFDALMKVKQV
ncbi:MAG: hypothetical protein BWY19_00690 [bacterium ADurb.Bin212]|nr:MAG: hypothetical protein BWY19_00690 [bacterium ADurb.Bin212]